MNENQDQKFLQVDYNLLATQKLNSTQKLFVSYIIGWQRTGRICFETNKTLATKFGKKYGGIRSVLTSLNKFEFFKSISKDYNEENSTSGHEITVDVDKLEKFLIAEKPIQKSTSTKGEFNNGDNSNLPEVKNIDEYELEKLPTYRLNDTVDLNEILSVLDFNKDDTNEVIQHFQAQQVIFDSFADYFVELSIENKTKNYKGIIISKEQQEKFPKLLAK